MQLCAVCGNIGQHSHKTALMLSDTTHVIKQYIYIYCYSAAVSLKSSKDYSSNLKKCYKS